MEREVAVAGLRLGEGAAGRRAAIDVSAGEEHLDLEGGAVVRSWRALHGSMEVEALALRPGLFRVGARVHNATPWDGAPREETLRQTFCSSHMVLSSPGGRFVSAADPPAELRAEAEACENVGVWPVLAGEDGERGTMLCSPIILEDHPRIAPESPGDLFDGGEIDGLLVLNILALTDEEKREMRAADPRAREILERTEALSQEQLLRLHGTFREVGIAPRP
jgi:hydrogenase maturation protease